MYATEEVLDIEVFDNSRGKQTGKTIINSRENEKVKQLLTVILKSFEQYYKASLSIWSDDSERMEGTRV